MSQYLNRVRDVDPNDSEAVKETLTAFFQNLSKHKDIDCNRWLRTLENVINRFPKYCGQHRATIENHLSHFLESNNYFSVIEAAKCAHAVQQVRPQQEKTASAKSCWRDQMTILCDAAHTLIEALFTKSANIYNRNINIQKKESLSLSPLQATLVDLDIVSKAQDIANKSSVLCIRLRNVLVFIQAMLVEIYPVAKPIRPQLILEVILKALSSSGSEDSSDVTTVKVQALRTLDAMVACLGSNLIPFSALVFRFVMQTLRWSSEHPSEESRKVRVSAYNSLTRWLAALRVHRECTDRARPWDHELTSHVVGDVTPRKHVIQLTASAQPMKNLSKKARKKLANSMLMQSNISSHVPGEKNRIIMSEESNDDVAIAALECAETFLMTCGIFLKPTIHKQLQELLVRECFALGRAAGPRATCLLRALEACRKACGASVPPPTQYCLQLYSTLVSTGQPEISKFCSEALLDIRLHLHCSPPSINFALEARPEKKQREEKRKRLSEKNREALEQLLGKDRMPRENPAEEIEQEIITISDEPSNKRLRIDEDITDKISLSSESAASVEISDDSSVEEIADPGLDDSTDYIIEPIMEKGTRIGLEDYEFSPDPEQVSEHLTFAEKLDETDGRDNVEADNDNAVIILSQLDKPSTSKANLFEINTQNIFDIKTQLPRSVDTIEGEKSPPLSMEVAYDNHPNTGQEKVTVLEKMDEDNLPSTNETDDVQITCGQTLKCSQDNVEPKELEINVALDTNGVPKENGIDKSPERIVENGDAANSEIEGEDVASKVAPCDGQVTVEDMLADFVDEVNESQTQA